MPTSTDPTVFPSLPGPGDPPASKNPNWWRQAVVYQIYPRSFADSDGDGIGDLPGITSRVGYLKDLGIDAVWLSPFYPSHLADGGYDVDDYRNVDPRLGTLDDFDELVAALHGVGIRVLVDIVPNHSSDRHEWFQAAVAAGRGSPERARYHFRDGLGEHGELPPADWLSWFGGPGWTQVSEPDGSIGQWYLHTFAREQPDWNWDHPEVRADFLRTLRFWADRGVDGFRVDVAHALVKDLSADPLPSHAAMGTPQTHDDGSHPLWDRDGLLEVYAQWREVFNSYDPPRTAVAEAFAHPKRQHRYAAPTSLGQVFNFDLLHANFVASEYREIIDRNLRFAAETGSSNTWVLSNHDVVRHATRFGLPNDPSGNDEVARAWDLSGGADVPLDAARGLRRARAATLLLLALPGSTYLYQGEELGLPSITAIAAQDRQDPTFFRNPGVDVGRDGCRIPIPWQSHAPAFGFGPTDASHLPQPDRWADLAVDAQLADPASTLHLYRAALRWRRELECAFETLQWLTEPNSNLQAFRRANGWVSVTNFGPDPAPLPPALVDLNPVLTSSTDHSPPAVVPGETTLWLRGTEDSNVR